MSYTAHTDTFARDNLPPRSQWPEFLFELPELKYPARLNCATELLDKPVTRGYGHRIALRSPDGECTYTQLFTQTNRLANALVREIGLKPGNRVLLRGPNNPMMAAAWLAVMKAGGVCVATMPLLRAKELTDIITKAEVTHALCGTPPIAFTFGLGGMLCFPMRYGASTVLVEKHTPETLLETIERFKANTCFTTPIMYRQMAAMAKEFDLRSLRNCVSAGEALPDPTRQAFKEATGVEIIDGIGSTEMMHIFISHTPERVRRGATGYAIPGYRATVLDEDGKPCKPGMVGRLAVKGPTGCRYLADERQHNYVQHGWNVTGDAYLMDEDGYF